MNKTKITAEPGKQELFIEREFDAPRDLVFKAFIDPKLYVRWLGPRELTTKLLKFEPRSGGGWRYIQKNKAGDQFGFHGVNHEVLPPERMIDTFEYEGLPEAGHVSLETAKFEFLPDGRTKLNVQVVFQSVEDRDGMIKSGMERGINESHERLDELLAKMLKTTMNQKQFTITRAFNAPRQKVFKAWTEPKQIMKWWGPKGFTAPAVKVDLKPGGQYLYAMRDEAGKMYWSGGEFKKVEAPRRLVVLDHFTDEAGNKAEPADYGLDENYPKEATITVTFKEDRGQTVLNISYDMPKAMTERQAMVKSGMTEGWNSSLDKLQALVEKK